MSYKSVEMRTRNKEAAQGEIIVFGEYSYNYTPVIINSESISFPIKESMLAPKIEPFFGEHIREATRVLKKSFRK